MKDEIIIRISEDKTISVDISEDGSILHKNISPEALVNALVEGCKEEEFYSGVLPKERFVCFPKKQHEIYNNVFSGKAGKFGLLKYPL